MKNLIIVGAGGLGREVFWVVQEINRVEKTWNVLGFLDDDAHALDGFSDYGNVLGPIEHYRELKRPHAICTIGTSEARKEAVCRMDAMNARWATLIDPSAAIGIGSTVGEGCVFRKHAVAGVNATIGNHVILGYSAHVSHDSRIGDYCTLCGHVDVNGGAVVGEGAFLGSHACVLPKIRVGDWAIVGAGSVAARDVLGASTVFGVPGKTAIHGKRKAS